eukprot:TRINITY_DN208_c0_g1_i2.p1 TRINITY_DN208_c0_g1~~TRINITY_DN208_c0_g1_i2.p1  ORF type:complete len:446 (+),score=161.44 TRINITY_DN208_c0_g1_i2:66-1403(+)
MSSSEEESSERSGSEEESSEEEDPKVEVENDFYSAQDLFEEKNWEDAAEGFEGVIELEADFLSKKKLDEAKWTFKSMQNLGLIYGKLKKNDKIQEIYKKILTYKGDDITENILDKAISSILDSLEETGDDRLLVDMYNITDEILTKNGNTRSLNKVELKKARAFLNLKNWGQLKQVLRKITQSLIEQNKRDQLLDVYALEIQMFMALKDKVGVQSVYDKAKKIVENDKGVLSTKLAIFNYCGGKILMEDRQFATAYNKLYEAFEYFVESGSDLMIPCLKYMLMANMLSISDKVNPFVDKNAQPLQQHKSIKPLSDLLDAYEKKDIKNFEEILRLHPQEITEDDFLNQFIQEILTKVRIEVIKDKIKPYTSIRLGYLAKSLNITSKEVEGLIVRLILDGEIFAKVDQIKQVMILSGSGGTTGKYQSMEKWAKQLHSISGHLSNAIH